MVDEIARPAETGAVGESESKESPRAVTTTKPDLLSLAGLVSLGAGAIHATAAGAHSEHKEALWAFVGVALFQLAWGVLAMLRSGRLVALIGVVGNGAAVGGWVWAKVDGISFVQGLDEKESVQLADGLAAGLAIAAVLFALVALVGVPRLAGQPRSAFTGVAAVLVLALAVPGMYKTGGHAHAGGHDEMAGGDETAGGHAHGTEAGAGDEHAEARPYDPKLPIDLSGFEGVSPEQQARAENLIAITLNRLPQFADPADAYAAGYRSIGDAATGVEHFIKWDIIEDDVALNPDFPESLVYEVDEESQTFMYPTDRPPPAGTRKLVSAMFMLTSGDTLETVPDVGGALTQWHIHSDLCFNTDPRIVTPGAEGPRVIGVTGPNQPCERGFALPQAPMLHVWIEPHPCGPFAALEGVGAGQIKPGEERLCDHEHGAA